MHIYDVGDICNELEWRKERPIAIFICMMYVCMIYIYIYKYDVCMYDIICMNVCCNIRTIFYNIYVMLLFD